MVPRVLTKGNTQLTRQNDFSFIQIALVYCLTRKTLRCNSLVQKICMFLQKETSHCNNSLALGPQGPKHYVFGNHFYSKNTRKLRFHVFLHFDARKYVIFPIMGPRGLELNWNKFTISYEFVSVQVK